MGGQGIRLFKPSTHIRMEANTFGCRSESLITDGFTCVIYARIKKRLDLESPIYNFHVFRGGLKMGIHVYIFTVAMYKQLIFMQWEDK